MNEMQEDDITIPEASPPDEFYDPFESSRETLLLNKPEYFPDSIEGYNRGAFVFNDKMYFYFIKPAAYGFKYLFYPVEIRLSIKKFFINLAMPVRFLNCLFQGKLKGAGIELSRFLINTTVGIVGFFDPATRPFKLMFYDEDMGQTFGVWGMGSGFYFVLPFFGPSSGRDALGKIFDLAFNPGTYLPGSTILVSINNTSLSMGEYEDLKKSSFDPYVAIRDAYFEYRQNLVSQ
jgi:phospholipid-binding lipoprotein MlaA